MKFKIKHKLSMAFSAITLLAIIIAIAATVYLIKLKNEADYIGNELSEVKDASIEILNHSSKAHALLERRLQGDESINQTDIWKEFELTEKYISAIKSGIANITQRLM